MTKNILLIVVCLCIFISGCSGKYHTIKVDIMEQDQCVPKPFVRNNYFAGQALTTDDFKNEQDYHIGKQNLHNKFLHGWGVVCGLWIVPSAEYDDRVILMPGVAIDGEGREIVVSKSMSMPIGAQKTDLYIAIEYKPIPTGFVPNLDGDASLESMQARKIEESFDFAILQDLPDEYESTKDLIERSRDGDIIDAIFRNHLVCCPKNMPIVLAKIHVDGGKIREGDIDNISYRRLVLNSSDIAILLSNTRHKK